MHLLISQRTDTGRVRTSNQDACSVDLLDPRRNAALLLVADGMGGYEGGEVASRLAVETVRNRVLLCAPDWAEKGCLGDGLIEAFHQANQAILDAQREQPRLNNMGTTLTAALIWGERVFLGHVGDSKALFIGRGGHRQITTDHNVAGELVQSGHITADQAALHPQRHVLTRALGVGEQVAVERQEESWQSSDRLLLATDGLTTLVRAEEICALSEELSVAELADRLVDLANSRGGPDNITVLAAQWEG